MSHEQSLAWESTAADAIDALPLSFDRTLTLCAGDPASQRATLGVDRTVHGPRRHEQVLRSTDAAAPVPLPPLIGSYRLGRRLGAGGMSDVVAAFDLERSRAVALKVLRPRRVGRREEREAWDREVSILASLQHPGIVSLLDAGIGEGGELYLAMPLLEGRSARQELATLRLAGPGARAGATFDVLLPAFLDVCEAVQHAHERGVLHCDLKPGNVFVPRPEGGRGRALLLDWGVAVARQDGRVVSQGEGGRAGGTPGYMSPEQILEPVGALDPRSDVWGLGALLYELLTWRPAVRRASPQGMFRETLAGAIRPPAELRGPFVVPTALSDVCSRALALRREDRPADPGSLARELRALLS